MAVDLREKTETLIMEREKLDSNNLKTRIHGVCYPCGVTANVLTCLMKFGQRPKQVAFQISTYHTGECDFCGETTSITEARDFFYPDFSLIGKVAEFLSKNV